MSAPARGQGRARHRRRRRDRPGTGARPRRRGSGRPPDRPRRSAERARPSFPPAGRGLALALRRLRARPRSRTAFSELDRLDVLVNCAGVTGWMDAVDPSEETWDRVIDTNLKGTFFCSIAAARLMRSAGGGSIVNVSSVLATRGMPNSAAYAASKGGINALTVQLAIELAPARIRVNAFAPGATNVERNLTDDPPYLEAWAPVIPLGRVAEPSEMVGPGGLPRLRRLGARDRPALLRRRRLDRDGKGARGATSTRRGGAATTEAAGCRARVRLGEPGRGLATGARRRRSSRSSGCRPEPAGRR